MAILAQGNLFSWKEIDVASDLERLKLVLSIIPDEYLMQKMESRRGKGRNDYPVRAMWNALLAGVVFQHPSSASLIRELRRNREMADLCGFDPLKGMSGVPSEDAFGRFLGKIVLHRDDVMAMFEDVVCALAEAIPDLGQTVAIDAKAIESKGNPVTNPDKKANPDGRRDTDADWGVKSYKGVREDGTAWEKTTSWFGYKLHLIVDSKYEIPLAFSVTKASRSDLAEGRELVRQYNDKNSEVSKRTRVLTADRGYDSGDWNYELHDKYGILPVIDTRRMWKEESTRALHPNEIDTIIYDERGQVSCVCPWSGEIRDMAFMGYEKDRKSLKYRCPAVAYGLECAGRWRCEAGRKVGKFGRIVRVPLAKDHRIFTPLARHTYKWIKEYKRRTAVERYFSRVAGVFNFDNHTIRGRAKMETRLGMAFLVSVCMALARIRQGQAELIRSLVAPAIAAA